MDTMNVPREIRNMNDSRVLFSVLRHIPAQPVRAQKELFAGTFTPVPVVHLRRIIRRQQRRQGSHDDDKQYDHGADGDNRILG